MSFKVFPLICLHLVLTSGQHLDTNPTSSASNKLLSNYRGFDLIFCLKIGVKETIYDINLYITLPAGVIALGLLLCLCYCLISSCKSGEMQPFQPVIVTNRNSPLVVSAQTTSNNDSGAHAISGSAPHQNTTASSQTTAQNPVVGSRRQFGPKKTKSGPLANQMSVRPKNNSTDQMKAPESQPTQRSDAPIQSYTVHTPPPPQQMTGTSSGSQRPAQNVIKNSGAPVISPSVATQSAVGTTKTGQSESDSPTAGISAINEDVPQ